MLPRKNADMNILTRFAANVPGFGFRKLTFDDFMKACDRLGIIVARHQMPTLLGCYTRVAGSRVIFLDNQISGQRLNLVAFHELAHAVLHEGDRDGSDVVFYHQRDSHEEHEADIIAFVATNYEKPFRNDLRKDGTD